MIGKPLTGIGSLAIDGARYDGVRYHIEIHRDARELLYGRGRLSGLAKGIMLDIFDASARELTLQDGRTTEIVPSQADLAGAALTFTCHARNLV